LSIGSESIFHVTWEWRKQRIKYLKIRYIWVNCNFLVQLVQKAENRPKQFLNNAFYCTLCLCYTANVFNFSKNLSKNGWVVRRVLTSKFWKSRSRTYRTSYLWEFNHLWLYLFNQTSWKNFQKGLSRKC